MTCCHRCATADQFDPAIARRDLRRFRRRGPDAPTRHLLAAVQARSLPPQPTLLDIGGGVGAIHHVLLEHGFSRATHLDASGAYLAAAADEARRLGHADRVQFQLAEFPAEASTVPSADVVTLNRVVCCDPDYVRLLGAAANRARHVVAFSYPRPRWLTRLFVTGANVVRRLRGRGFRAYVHPPARMSAVLEGGGMRRAWAGGTWIWAVEVFERAA
jgi:2-polyprenyl-3-methyl-5-hydroxy-6-metoxy-1,4-benzoquinol methylase